MQQQVSGHYWKDIVPVMASVFDELSNNEETIRIDRLEIDLGVLSEKEINQSSWEGAILEAIRKQLFEKIGERQRSPWVIHEPKVISTCRQWLFYMQKGYLPWNAVEVNGAWYDIVLETLAVDHGSVSELRKVIKLDPVVSHRIVVQHKTDFLVKLIEILTAQRHQDLPGIIEVLDNMFLQVNLSGFKGKKIMKSTQTIWLLLIREVAGSEKQLSSQSLVESILRRHWPLNSNFHFPDKKNVLVRDIIFPVVNKLKKEGVRPASADTEMDTHEKVFDGYKKEKNKIESIDQGIYLQNAGVVLLHPFLSSLFKRLKFVKEGRFENIQAQQRALYVIHYMATGHVGAEEYELPVAKVLCAWALDKPVAKNIELSPDELSETDAMIGVAIEQWAVVKNTSVNGLREGFLQRSGKLFTEKDKVYLRIETQAIDVLLDQLPWVLSMIKLPWMKELLRVEWR